MPHPESDASRLVTVSVGAASLQPGRDAASPAELVADADRALYAAKTAGRNCARAAVSSRPVPSAESIPYTPPP
jgi:two-component system chemotaxis family response regulator WspR